MKLIIAIIRPYHLELVQPALQRQNLSLTSVSEVLSGGEDESYPLIYRERVVKVRRPKYRMDLLAVDYQAEDAVEIMRAETTAGCPGKVSDAKIMVLQLDEVPAPKRKPAPARLNGKHALCTN